MNRKTGIALLAGMACLACALGSRASAQDVPAQWLPKIQAALPDKPIAEPKQARKLLIFNLANGYVHSSIPVGTKALVLMGEKTGAYTATVSNDPEVFEPDSLKNFDAVCMISTTGDIFMPKNVPADKKADAEKHAAMLEKSLEDWVASGKGWVGIHAATDSCYNRPNYGKMIGGWFNGHPWHELVSMRVEDPRDALTSMFPDKFSITDEIYTFRAPYSRDNTRVLVSLDYKACPQKGNRADNDYAVSWVKPWGQGRVFYCSLGHEEQIYCNPMILKHYLAGIQFAMGDLDASMIPHLQPAD